jgi:hypothetical protein
VYEFKIRLKAFSSSGFGAWMDKLKLGVDRDFEKEMEVDNE